MKKSFLYGIISLAVLAILAVFNMGLFIKVTAIIAIATIGIAGIFLKTFVRGREFNVNVSASDDRENRSLGLVVAAFGLPYIITAIIILIFTYYVWVVLKI